MNKQRHVTLAVALCAATMVHAFIFFFYKDRPSVAPVQLQPIEVTLLPQQAKKPTASRKPDLATETKQKQVKTTQIIANKQALMPKPVTQAPTPKVAVKQEFTQQKVEAKKQPQQANTLIPSQIKHTILANIMYPRQAKRHGWEGQVDIQLEIGEQSIKTVTILQSSGHQILDNAARKGIVAMRSLPLSNGVYKLPVIFRLQ